MPLSIKTKAILLLASLGFSISAETHAADSLCNDNESVYFSCTTKSNKLLSLCYSKTNPNSNRIVTYRFGTKSRVKLSFSSSDQDIEKYFSQNHYIRPLTDYLLVNIKIENYQYSIFKNYDASLGESAEFGVIVHNMLDSASEHRINCTSVSTDNLLDFAKKLPCNPESALGCSAL